MSQARNAVEGWEGGSDDEDTLTGDLGATLRTASSQLVFVDGAAWSWRVRYKKFRGRGGGAFETISGADGIFQVEVTRGPEKQFKGLLFQAKKVTARDGDLRSQVEHMERLAEGGSAVFEYGPRRYQAAPGHAYRQIGAPVRRRKAAEFIPLDRFLGDSFLPCITGLRGMYYDALRGLLLLPSGIAHRVSVRHRISVEAEELT